MASEDLPLEITRLAVAFFPPKTVECSASISLNMSKSKNPFHIDEADVIERILRHLGLWETGVRVGCRPRPVEPVIEPWLDDPFPDYDNEPVFAEN